MENLRTRIIVIAVVLFTTILWFAPNLMGFGKMTDEQVAKHWWPSKKTLSMGLDIQGGLHLVMGIDEESALNQHLRKIGLSIKDYLTKEKKVTIDDVKVLDASSGKIRMEFSSPSVLEPAMEYMEDTTNGQGSIFQVLNSGDNFIEARFFEPYLRRFKKGLVDRTIETIRNRIDDLGVKEPIIAAQSNNRILIQLAGVKDSAEAKELINKTAKLEFMIVDPEFNPYEKPDKVAEVQGWIKEAEEAGGFAAGKDGLKMSDYVEKINEALATKLPKNRVIRFGKSEGAKTLEAGVLPYVLERDSMMTGETLNDSGVSLDQTGQPIVTFSFDPKGAKEFGNLTTTHVKKLMAVVLDGIVQTAPRLKSPITGGSGIIELGSGNRDETMKEANLISMVLRSGSLPAELEQLEERTVGPTLGHDSIEKGKFAGLMGALLVFIFMLVYYRSYGVLADVALAFNILMVLAVLTSLQATLTLPGVAGIALTIGMAVDANVIIFERIKEEMAKGSGLAASIKEGYSRAFWAIFDANITTAGVCIVLMYFGSGPIRGFAITLICGIVTSMFTAIFFTRTILNLLVNKMKLNFAP